MQPNTSPELTHPSPDLEHLQPNRVELRAGPRRGPKMTGPQAVHQDIGHRMEEEAELIGLEPMAGGPVGAEMGFMVLDQKLHHAPVAVESLVDDARGQRSEIRHDEPCVRSEGAVLGLDHDPLLRGPAPGSIAELPELPDRSSFPLETAFGRLDPRRRLSLKRRVRRHSQEETQIVFPAKIEDLGGRIVRVGPQEDAHLRPRLPDLSDDPLEDRHDLLSRGPFPRPQDRRDELPRPALVNMDRHETVLVEVGVEERQLLMPVHRITGVVDVEEDSRGRSPVGTDKGLAHCVCDPIEVGPGEGVLQPRERRLAGQGFVPGKSAAGHLQDRIEAQPVGIVGVFVAAGDLIDPLRDQLPEGMARVAGVAAFRNDRGHPPDEAHPPFDLPKKKRAGVGGDLPAVEIGRNLFSLDVFKKKAFGARMIHGCFLLRGLCKRIVNQYVGGETAFFMNNSG